MFISTICILYVFVYISSRCRFRARKKERKKERKEKFIQYKSLKVFLARRETRQFYLTSEDKINVHFIELGHFGLTDRVLDNVTY